MKITASKLSNCSLITFAKHQDKRGSFNKLYHADFFKQHNIETNIKEQFYSVSAKNVLRGMHFQLPPYQHNKLVSCLAGSVLDVVLDLRKNSITYGQFDSFHLSQNDNHILHIPSGMAHGFLSLEDNSGMLYNTSTTHKPELDCGIHWDSFGFDWSCDNPIVSDRDQKHATLNNFSSPFK